MSKNLHEPSTPRAVATNRYTGKLTQQKPYAFEWVTPVNAADCAAAQVDTPWIPCYLNDWEQPTTLEPLSVRMNADGLLQWQGYVNSAIATSAIAFIMPGTLGGEPDMIPPDDPGNLSYNVFVTPDDGTTIGPARAYVDSTTGEVSIYPIGGGDAVCYLATWNYDTTNSFPTATWRYVANITNDSYFQDAWLTSDSPGMTYNFDTGIITMSDSAAYDIVGWVQFWDDFADGEERIIALNFGSSDRVINVYNLDSAHGSIGGHKLFVSAPKITTGAVALEIWHNHGSDIDVRDAELSVTRSTLVSDMTYTARP